MAPRTKSQATLDAEQHFDDSNISQLPATSGLSFMPEPEYDDVTALNNVLAELGEDSSNSGFVTVFRETVDASGKKPDEYLERFPASDFSLDSLKARWGSGKYKINVYQDGRILTRKVITIARDPQAVSVVHAQPAPVDLTPLLVAIKQTGDQTMQAILALAQASQQKQPSRMDMLQEMQMMRDIIGGGNQPAPSPVTDPLALMKFGAEMALNGAGGGEGNNAWIDKMLTTFGPLLTTAMEKPPTAPVRPSLPSPVPHPAAVEQPKPLEEDPVNMLVTNYLNLLARAAQQNAPVEEYADSILAMIPASEVAEVENLLRPVNWRERIKAKTNVAEQYPVWFSNLRDTLLQYIDEDKAEASTHLTGSSAPDSVPGHENANSANPVIPQGDPASPA